MKFDKKVIVVDDFYPDPILIRKLALEAEYETWDLDKNYPGVNTLQSYWSSEIQALITKAVNEPVYPTPTSSCGYFRYIREEDKAKQIIHFDPKPEQTWAGVIYLSLPEHYIKDGKVLDVGTKMYLHKESGMSTAPINSIEAAKIGVTTFDDMKVFFETQGLDESLWDVELNVPIKFNRAVFFRPWLWHGIAGHFGTNVFDSRLTQLIFLNTM
jgi:hypothetical protein